MAKRTHLMWHCADTPGGPDGIHFTAKDIERWHTSKPPKGNGWSKVGYTVLLLLNGTTEILTPFDSDDIIEWPELTYGAAGWNGLAMHGCTMGGKDNIDDRTEGQLAAQEAFSKMAITIWPDIKLIGHNQVNKKKYCPSYDVREWAESIGIPSKNIDYKIYW